MCQADSGSRVDDATDLKPRWSLKEKTRLYFAVVVGLRLFQVINENHTLKCDQRLQIDNVNVRFEKQKRESRRLQHNAESIVVSDVSSFRVDAFSDKGENWMDNGQIIMCAGPIFSCCYSVAAVKVLRRDTRIKGVRQEVNRVNNGQKF